MQDEMYSAFFGAMSQEAKMNTITNNLANVNTTGYKRDKIAFEDVFTRYASDYGDPNMTLEDRLPWPESKLRSQTRPSPVHLDLQDGGMKKTGNPLDMAISGEGFFEVITPEGETAYTRNGSFLRNPETGHLVTGQNFELQGEGGPIEIPEDASNIVIGENGEVLADGDLLDVINLTTFTDLNALEKKGRQLVQVKDGADSAPIPAEDVRIEQGYLENSNVDPVYEMVNMISTMRNFEALQKMMTSSHEKDQQLIQQVGTVR